MKRHDNRAWLLLMPVALAFVFVGALPLITNINYSFFDIFLLDKVFWIGTDWYRDIVTSARFYESLARSLLFSAIVLSLQVPLGVGVAMIIPRRSAWGISILMLVALPLVVPWNIIPIMWLSFIDPVAGYAGRALAWLGTGFNYKFNAIHTWIVLVIMDTWHWLGLVVVLAYSGLSGIPYPYYQAAAIDGASRYQVFRLVELPRLSGPLSMVITLRFVDSFMIYTEAFRINAGGPNAATMFLSLDLGEEIAAFNYGPAAARSVVYVLMVLTIAWAFKTVMESGRVETEQAA